MRNTCMDCVRKHLGQASVLLGEAVLGYPDHAWLAAGHLAEAEVESAEQYPKFSVKVREVRLQLMEAVTNFPVHAGGPKIPNVLPLIREACEIVIRKHNRKPEEFYTEDNQGI